MPRIFGRDAPPDHPLEAKLAPLDQVQGSSRFIAENWRHDWRVPGPREDVVVGRTRDPACPPDLAACYREYRTTCICHGAPSEYLQGGNQSNLVASALRRDTWLCRAVCLDSFRLAAAEAMPGPRAQSPDAWRPWLTDQIAEAKRGRGLLGLRDLLEELFSAWNGWSRLDDRPAWASFWDDAAPFAAGPDWADRMRDAFGLGGYGDGSWLVLLRYQVADVGLCYRPTSLDADWQPWHVLSPPGEAFGYTVDLSASGGRCCPEVIHAPMPLHIGHWTGQIGRVETPSREYDLQALRARHYGALRTRFGRAGDSWLPSTRP
jgi:hypothetical protein